ncbi:GGDEF domain-containing protein [Pseudoxanthobacter sp.]|uniref:GGDEF domain-containing protein n=1 Tax=Pseudoxanthobacter sp. TaxID=1925742 RepID=UPI002FDF2DC1
MTGIFDRRGFLVESQAKLDAARTAGTTVALLAFDIDNMVVLTESYGETAAAAVRARFAAVASHCLRRHDVFGEMGPAAFSALLSNLTAEQALVVAERVRQAFAASGGIGADNPATTVSIGVALARGRETDLQHLMQAAGRALEEARSTGSGRIAGSTAARPPAAG